MAFYEQYRCNSPISFVNKWAMVGEVGTAFSFTHKCALQFVDVHANKFMFFFWYWLLIGCTNTYLWSAEVKYQIMKQIYPTFLWIHAIIRTCTSGCVAFYWCTMFCVALQWMVYKENNFIRTIKNVPNILSGELHIYITERSVRWYYGFSIVAVAAAARRPWRRKHSS